MRSVISIYWAFLRNSRLYPWLFLIFFLSTRFFNVIPSSSPKSIQTVLFWQDCEGVCIHFQVDKRYVRPCRDFFFFFLQQENHLGVNLATFFIIDTYISLILISSHCRPQWSSMMIEISKAICRKGKKNSCGKIYPRNWNRFCASLGLSYG